MPKTIDELYEAAIESIEAFATTYPGYWKVQDKVSRAIDALRENLSEEQWELVQKLDDAHYRMDRMESKSDFASGFIWGSRLMMDVFLEK